MTEHELDELTKKIRYDLTAAQAKLTELSRMVGALNLQTAGEHRCPECDVRLRGPLSLAEHRYNSHDGPKPEHYDAAERLAGITEEGT